MKEVAAALSGMNAIAALASGSMGPVLAEDLIGSGELVRLAKEEVRPFYRKKAEHMEECIRRSLDGTDYRFHRIEGSIFAWLYLPSLSIPTLEFYSILMKEGVITVPGEYFFFGHDGEGEGLPYPHDHYDKCLRLNYSGPDDVTEKGLEIIGRKYREYSK